MISFTLKQRLISLLTCTLFSTIFMVNLSYAQAPYCDPSGADCSWGDAIDGVTIEDQDGNIVFSNTGTGCGTDGYQDFTNISGTLTPGETYDVTVEILDTWEQGVALWLDYDNSEEFNDDHYLATSPSDNHTSANPAEFSFTLPENSVPGETRLRVGCMYFGIPDPSDYCGHGIEGEYEDYSVEIESPEPLEAKFIAPDTSIINSDIVLQSPEDNATEYKWFVNGNEVSNDRTFIFNESTIGTYVITHEVSNIQDTESYSHEITLIDPVNILSAPSVNFYSDKNVVTFFEEINLYDNSTQFPQEWEWTIIPDTFPDPELPGSNLSTYQFNTGSKDVPNPSISFSAWSPGSYDVSLQVTGVNDSTVSKTEEDFITVAHSMCPTTVLESTDDFYPTNDPEGFLVDHGSGSSELGWNAPYSEDNCEGFTITDVCSEDLYIVVHDLEIACGDDFLRIYDGEDADGEPLYDNCKNEYGLNGFTGGGNQNCETSNVCLPEDTLWSESGSFHIEFDDGPNPDNLRGFKLEWGSSGKEGKRAPQARIEGPDTVCAGSTVNFENRTTGKVIEGYAWDYQAPSETIDSQSVNGSFMYPIPQIEPYKVHLYAWDCAGNVDTAEHEVVVIDPDNRPTANIEASSNDPWTGDTVQLNAEIDGCADDFQWNADPSSFEYIDGYDENSLSPYVVFTEPGCYDISLNMENQLGDTTITEQCLVNVRGDCQPTAARSIQDIGVSNIKISNVNMRKPTGDQVFHDFYNEGYPVVELKKGQTYTITLERVSSANPVDRAVWIDYTQTGYIDSIDLVSYQSNGDEKTYSSTFKVPGYAKTGETKMRIGSALGGSGLNYCGGLNVAEFTDLLVNIQPDTTKPEITLLGDNPHYMNVFDSYNDSGAVAYDNASGDITDKINVDISDVDTSNVGEYTVNYNVTDESGNTAKAERIVIVEDNIPPEISLIGEDTIEHLVNNEFDDPGVQITDNYWEDIEPDIESDLNTYDLGIYEIEYCATDGSGNGPVCITRIVEVTDTIPPEINFEDEYIQVEAGSDFNAPEYSINDNYWSEEDHTIQHGGSFINTDTLGVFTFAVTATDGSENTSTEEIVIEVVDTTPPNITLNGSKNVHLLKHDEWTDPGVEVTDNYDDDPEVITGGTFESTGSEGIFTRTYVAVDQSGNKSEELTRNIFVGSQTTNISGRSDIDQNFSLYPNPVDDNLTIENNINIDYKFVIRDISGRLINDGNVDARKPQYEIDMTSIEPGSYMISIIIENEKIKNQMIQVR